MASKRRENRRTKSLKFLAQHGTPKQLKVFKEICHAQSWRLASSNFCDVYTDKITYFTEKSAEDMQRKRWIADRVKLRIYPCPFCKGYHLSKPDENM